MVDENGWRHDLSDERLALENAALHTQELKFMRLFGIASDTFNFLRSLLWERLRGYSKEKLIALANDEEN